MNFNGKVVFGLVTSIWLIGCGGAEPVVTDVCGGCPSVDRPICDPRMKLCVPCGGTFDEPACAERGEGTPYCALSGNKAGACVACTRATQAFDCKDGAAPVCGDEGSCRKCMAHQECASGVCGENGACVLPKDIAYVNNASSSCSDNPHLATPVMPFCEIQAAIAMGSYSNILVSGSTKPYGGIKITDVEKLSLIGPGKDARPTARISAPNGYVAEIISPNKTSQISFDGFEFVGKSGLVSLTASLSSHLTVRRSHFHDIGQKAQSDWRTSSAIVANCPSTIDANEIGPNNYSGIHVGRATITNNVIHNNIGSFAIVVWGGHVAHNTLVANRNIETQVDYYEPFQISCQAETLVENSIIVGGTDDRQLFLQDCKAHNVVTATTNQSGSGKILLDPVWLTGSLFKPDVHAPITQKLIDTALPMTDLVVDHDFNGNPRPQGKGGDIGAYELM